VRRILSLTSWLVMVPVFAMALAFALHNKSLLELNLWPFGLVVEIPVYLGLFGAVFVGVIVGGIVAWLGQGRVRSNLRGQAYEGEVARRELTTAQEKIETLERDIEDLKTSTRPRSESQIPATEIISEIDPIVPQHKAG